MRGEHIWSFHFVPVVHTEVFIKGSQGTLSLVYDVWKPVFTEHQADARHHTRPQDRTEDRKAEVNSAFTESTVCGGRQTSKHTTTVQAESARMGSAGCQGALCATHSLCLLLSLSLTHTHGISYIVSGPHGFYTDYSWFRCCSIKHTSFIFAVVLFWAY